jgi:CheY-like chemotaxis protein
MFARNGRDAVEIFKGERISLVLMNIEMSAADGFGTVKEIKGLENGTKIPIIALTAKFDGRDAEDCGCMDYVSMPIREEELMQVIERYLGR